MRTARFWAPWMLTCATPVSVDAQAHHLVGELTMSCDIVSEVSARKMIGGRRGLTLR
jgi:hypothetical protein